MKQLQEIVDFVFALQTRLKFGELSRAPLRLLRLQWQDDFVECEWVARSPDIWDEGLECQIRDCHASLQALKDAMAVRDVLFGTLPGVHEAVLRAFRPTATAGRELIISGTVSRETLARSSVSSLVMEAKLSGLQFWLEDGVLKALQTEDVTV